MKLLWITWKDRQHPEAGGAEVVHHELTKRLVADGHQVTILTARYPGSKKYEKKQGITYIRVGRNRYIHPLAAGLYFFRHFRNSFDVVIEEVQACAPYFAAFFGKSASRYLFYHQLARKNWLYEVPPPLSYAGYYVLAPAATRLIALSRVPVITVSESTRKELSGYGFSPQRTSIIAEGLHFAPVDQMDEIEKYERPTLLSLGTMRAMKRTLDQLEAFEIAKCSIPDLQFKIAGNASGAYGRKVLEHIARSRYRSDISYHGQVTTSQKKQLMQKSHLITVTSVEEGWGLVVSEANGQGTPAVVYNVAGLRDSVQHNRSGLVTKSKPAALAEAIVQLLQNREKYQLLRSNAYQLSRELTFDRSYQDFMKTIGAA